MTKIKPRVIGDIGEWIAQKHFEEQGFDLLQFGKAMRDSNVAPHKKARLLMLSDRFFGSSFVYSPYSGLLDAWEKPIIPRWADLSKEQITDLTRQCRAFGTCHMRDNKPKSAPCYKPDDILDRTRLSKITPEHDLFASLTGYDGKEIKLKGYNCVLECFRRQTGMLAIKHANRFPEGLSFRETNILIHLFIDALLEIETKRIDNQRFLNMKKIWFSNSPGRYDFVAHKDGEQYAVEVKVNKAKLNAWQILRANLLRIAGVKVLMVHITVDEENLQKGAKNQEPEDYQITISNYEFDDSKIKTPSKQQYAEVMTALIDNYFFRQEYYRLIGEDENGGWVDWDKRIKVKNSWLRWSQEISKQ